MPGEKVTLRASVIKRRILELGLKQWWLAEQLRVSRKTVSRWLNGSVKNTSTETAARLSDLIGLPMAEITTRNPLDVLGSRPDQVTAAESLLEYNTMDKLAASGDWILAEQLLRSLSSPDLPPALLGRLYCALSISCWRQKRLSEATAYAIAGLDIAKQGSLRQLEFETTINLATINALAGSLGESTEQYRYCTANPDQLDDRQMGIACNNLSANFYESGQFDFAFEAQVEALDRFRKGGTGMNLAIAHFQLALLCTETQRFKDARLSLAASVNWAQRCNFEQGVKSSTVLLCLIDALEGDRRRASSRLRELADDLEAAHLMDHLDLEIAGRSAAACGDPVLANQLLMESERRSPQGATAR